MERFFSKLDLRDIKIKPEGSRFLPDDDEAENLDGHVVASLSDEEPTLVIEEESFELVEAESDLYVLDDDDGHIAAVSYERVTITEIETVSAVIEPSSLNGTASAGHDAEVLKVSAKSRPSAVAGAIAGVVRENGRAEVQAIGAGATNQAIKAIAIAREYLLETNIDAVCIPAFIDVTIDNEDRTAIRLVVEQR